MNNANPRLLRSLSERIRPSDTDYRQRLVERAAKLDDVILMGLGDPDAPSPPHVVEAARKAIAEGHTKYTHPAGMPALREAIAALLGRDYGLDYTPEEIIVTPAIQGADRRGAGQDAARHFSIKHLDREDCDRFQIAHAVSQPLIRGCL
jgi:DNA-binding transcriptional MocR family regulator